MLLYHLGFFGIDWDNTPFLGNKASFRRQLNQAVRHHLRRAGRYAGARARASGINSDLLGCAGLAAVRRKFSCFGVNPFGPKTPTLTTIARRSTAFASSTRTCQLQRHVRHLADNHPVHRPYRQRSRRDIRHAGGAFGQLRERLVRYPRRRSLLVRPWPALQLRYAILTPPNRTFRG